MTRETHLHDPGLVPSDLLQGVTQLLGVFQVKGSNSAHYRLPNEVGSVILSPYSYLKQYNVHFLLDEDVQRHQQREGEVAGHHPFILGLKVI